MIKALIFDNDGVLIDSEASQIQAWEEFFRLHNKTFARHDLHLMTRGRPAREVVASVFPEADRQQLLDLAGEREKIHFALLKDNLHAVAGIYRFLEEAKESGYKLAVGTSAHLPKLTYILTRLNLLGYFDVLVTNDDVAHGKPAPDVFELAARKLNKESRECVVFEDALTGVEAARRAGMRVIVLTTSHSRGEFNSGSILGFIPDFSSKSRKRAFQLLEMDNKKT